MAKEPVRYITDYLLHDSKAYEQAVKVNLSSERLKARGKELVGSLGCLGCHKMDGKGIGFGPDFSDIGSKVRPEWLQNFLKDPKAYDPKTMMPDFGLNDDEIAALTAYIMSKRRDIVPGKGVTGRTATGAGAEKGRALIRDLGCAGCQDAPLQV